MADNNLQASFKKLMRYAQNLAEYEKGIADGIIDENVFVIVLEEKVAKFKGQTFDWSSLDISSLEQMIAAKQDKINDLDAIRSGASLGATAIQQVKTINGEEITGEGNIEIQADVDTSTLVTKEEFTDVEKVWAASYNLLNQKTSDVQQYIYDEAASRRQFDEAIAEIQSILLENEAVVTAAWNQLNTRINALEAAQRG